MIKVSTEDFVSKYYLFTTWTNCFDDQYLLLLPVKQGKKLTVILCLLGV